MDDRPTAAPIRSYGRVKARALKPRQAGLIDTLLPHLALTLPDHGEIDLVAAAAPVGADAGALRPPVCDDEPAGAPGVRRVVLEIGFGGGEHLAAQALRDPGALFLGAEPFLNGVGSCLRHIEESGATNVRLHHGDARAVLAALPAASLARAYILFPDPWPKTRHWKRRLIQPDVVDALARTLAPGGDVRFATDWKAYAAWTLEAFLRDARFDWIAAGPEDWRAPFEGHVRTRYEQKALGDTAPVFLRFRRR